MITMADIARRAGVSRATASFVLNDKDAEQRISAATRQRVLDAAQELGYRRNALARAIVTGKNFVIGIVEPGAGLEQRAHILEGALEEAEASGYLIKLFHCAPHTDVLEVAKRCAEQRLAGLIVLRPSHIAVEALYQQLLPYNIPLVLVDDNVSRPWAFNVTSDDVQGSRLAVEHLITLGHRRITLLTGSDEDSLSLMRETGYRETMLAQGLTIGEDSIVLTHWNQEQTHKAVDALFQRARPLPTALFCAVGDLFAAVAMRTLRALGLRVPEDVSVVGYGDFTFTGALDPPLTTIAQPFHAMGSLAVRDLLARIERPEETEPTGPTNRLLPTSLIVRRSTGRPPCPENVPGNGIKIESYSRKEVEKRSGESS